MNSTIVNRNDGEGNEKRKEMSGDKTQLISRWRHYFYVLVFMIAFWTLLAVLAAGLCSNYPLKFMDNFKSYGYHVHVNWPFWIFLTAGIFTGIIFSYPVHRFMIVLCGKREDRTVMVKPALRFRAALITIILLLLIPVAGMLTWTPVKIRYYAILMNKDPKHVDGAFNYLIKCGDKGLTVIENFCRTHTDDSWSNDNKGMGIKCRLKPNKYIYVLSEEIKKAFKGEPDEWLKYCTSSEIEAGDFYEVEIFNNTGNSIHVFEENGVFRPVLSNPKTEMYTIDGLQGSTKNSHPRGRLDYNLEVKYGKVVSRKIPIWLEWRYNVWQPGIYIIEKGLSHSVDKAVALRSNKICIAIIPEQ